MLPNPHAFYTVLDRLQVHQPGRAVFVSWSEEAAKAANKAGIPVIHLNPGRNTANPKLRIHSAIQSLVELGSVLGYMELDEKEQREQRLLDLSNKRGLTDAEMRELMGLVGGGGYAGNQRNFGFIDDKIARQNLWILQHSRREAAGRNLILEVLASTAILIEMELRTWLSVRTGRRFGQDDKSTLGRLVRDAKEAGLSPEMVSRLEGFVESRNIGIHRVIQGERQYFQLGQDFMADPSLYEDLKTWVASDLPAAFDTTSDQWTEIALGEG